MLLNETLADPYFKLGLLLTVIDGGLACGVKGLIYLVYAIVFLLGTAAATTLVILVAGTTSGPFNFLRVKFSFSSLLIWIIIRDCASFISFSRIFISSLRPCIIRSYVSICICIFFILYELSYATFVCLVFDKVLSFLTLEAEAGTDLLATVKSIWRTTWMGLASWIGWRRGFLFSFALFFGWWEGFGDVFFDISVLEVSRFLLQGINWSFVDGDLCLEADWDIFTSVSLFEIAIGGGYYVFSSWYLVIGNSSEVLIGFFYVEYRSLSVVKRFATSLDIVSATDDCKRELIFCT